ncbi:hypothetical protein CCAX7_47780 [Capsulimonas corticalis]|uniref:Uncharacterized protein n=1 Tax=Capsulimonas corticalis TaxID=2219043 RepID=A0A402CQ25_9BACT|nr:hypothetical protein [Capsulimonas corticalis]BDI32727.1 hypothetical protein CCAX7_47780 [Capsulimonas corticalis]
MTSQRFRIINLAAVKENPWPYRALIFSLIYLAFDCLLPLIRLDPRHLSRPQIAGLVILSTLAFMLLQMAIPRAIVGMRLPVRQSLVGVALSALIWWLCVVVKIPFREMPYALAVGVFLLDKALVGLSLTVALAFLGMMLSVIIREPKLLLPIALVIMAIDVVGVLTNIGFTANTIAQHPEVVHRVSVAMPSVGGLQPQAYVGPGDALFIPFFFGIVERLRLNMRGTFFTMYGLLALAMILAVIGVGNIPALFPMGFAVVLANSKHFKFDRSEVFAMIYVGGLATAAVLGFFLFTHTHLFHAH